MAHINSCKASSGMRYPLPTLSAASSALWIIHRTAPDWSGAVLQLPWRSASDYAHRSSSHASKLWLRPSWYSRLCKRQISCLTKPYALCRDWIFCFSHVAFSIELLFKSMQHNPFLFIGLSDVSVKNTPLSLSDSIGIRRYLKDFMYIFMCGFIRNTIELCCLVVHEQGSAMLLHWH